jgi:flagellar basal body rod protein FlgG
MNRYYLKVQTGDIITTYKRRTEVQIEQVKKLVCSNGRCKILEEGRLENLVKKEADRIGAKG